MFQSIIKRVSEPVSHAVADLAGKVMIVVPLLIAGLFLLAALHNYLVRLFGPVGADLALAGLFILIAVIMAVRLAVLRSSRAKLRAMETTKSSSPVGESGGVQNASWQTLAQRLAKPSPERELALSAAGSILPFILPKLLRVTARKLPIVTAAGAVLFLMSRIGNRRNPLPSGRRSGGSQA